MAFNLAAFKTRTLTAVIFVIVMLTGLLWNQWSFLLLFTVIHFGCWWEYLKLVEKIHNFSFDPFIKYFFCIVGYLLMLNIGEKNIWFDFSIGTGQFMVSIKWMVYIILLTGLIIFLIQNKQVPLKAKYLSLLGFVYISLSWGLMISLRTAFIGLLDWGQGILDFGWVIPIGIIFSIWINDTMAYIVGSFIGKTPFSKISPKKTWEGTIGGIILCVIVIGLLGTYINYGKIIESYHWYMIAAIAAIFGTMGDLLESKLKRLANVKDSGSLMPGHGGFLDRFDSLLAATPFVWLYVIMFMK